MYYQNIRGLRTKARKSIKAIVVNYDIYYVIVMYKTWLKEDIYDAELANFNEFSYDRKEKSGKRKNGKKKQRYLSR